VGGADQRPLGTYFLNATQQELAEAACLLDLSVRTPARRSALATGSGCAILPLELAPHGLGERPTNPLLGVSSILGPPRGDVAGDAAIRERGKVASEQQPASAETSFGLAPKLASMASTRAVI
jgi:hypothetical protein